jgi:hypothetical protein
VSDYDYCDYCGGQLPEGRWEKMMMTDEDTGESATINIPVRGFEVRLPAPGEQTPEENRVLRSVRVGMGPKALA